MSKELQVSSYGISKISPINDRTIGNSILKLRVSFPTKSFSEEEGKALLLVWGECFAGGRVDVFEEAVRRFIKNDKKGFFPSPGMIMAECENIMSEIAMKKEREESLVDRECLL
jgi:hypothetical protein